MQREGYWDYMGRRLREETAPHYSEGVVMSQEDLWKKELAEMQGYVHKLQLRIVDLNIEVNQLQTKINNIGGDPRQLELDFKSANI
jgi:hypothetical protein